MLSSNLRSTTEDSIPQVTHEMLGRIWPHTLRPVPPTTIIQFTPYQGVHQGTADIPRDAPVTAAVGEQHFPFHTCRPLHIEPFVVRDKQIQKTREYSDIVLTLHQTGNAVPSWSGGKLHFFLGTDQNRAAQLSLWLDMHIEEVYWHTAEDEKRLRHSDFLGWTENLQHPLLPTDDLPVACLQQMTEYYCLPHVFSFITLDINDELPLNPDGTGELLIRLHGELPIDTLGDAFQLGCVPAVHLVPMVSPPVSLTPDNPCYPLPLAETERLFRVKSIQTAKQPGEKAKAAQGRSPRGKPCHFLPVDQFHAKSDWLLNSGEPDNVYFQSLITDDLLGRLHNQIHFYGMDGSAAHNLSPQTVCAHYIGYHMQAMQLAVGDITFTQESVPAHLYASNITPVSPDFPPMVMGKSDWSLINLLNCPPFLLFHAESLKDFLRLYDCYAGHDRALSRRMQQHINGIIRIDAQPDRRLDYRRQGIPINGNTLHIYLDPACYENDGVMYQFCRMVDQLLMCFVVQNNFIMLKIYRQGEPTVLWEFRQRLGLRSEM